MESYSEHDPKLEEVAFDIPINGVQLSDDRGVYKASRIFENRNSCQEYGV